MEVEASFLSMRTDYSYPSMQLKDGPVVAYVIQNWVGLS